MFESFIILHELQPSAISNNRQIVHRAAEKIIWNTQALHVTTGQEPETSKMQLVAKIKFTVLHVLKLSFVPLPSLAMVLTNSNEHSMLLLRHDPQK